MHELSISLSIFSVLTLQSVRIWGYIFGAKHFSTLKIYKCKLAFDDVRCNRRPVTSFFYQGRYCLNPGNRLILMHLLETLPRFLKPFRRHYNSTRQPSVYASFQLNMASDSDNIFVHDHTWQPGTFPSHLFHMIFSQKFQPGNHTSLSKYDRQRNISAYHILVNFIYILYLCTKISAVAVRSDINWSININAYLHGFSKNWRIRYCHHF